MHGIKLFDFNYKIVKKENIMPEDKKSLWRKILTFTVKNPISVICILTIIYCTFQAFVLGNTPWLYKTIITGIVGVWIFMFIAKHLFKLILLIIAVACIFFGYVYWNGQDKRVCEHDGGKWNEETQTCEKKNSWWKNLLNFIKEKDELTN